MKRNINVIILNFLLVTCIVVATASAKVSDIFQYDQSKMDVGSVYHYVGSDIKGSNVINFYIYIQSKDSIEVYKAYDGSVYLTYVTFDWNHMMRSKTEQMNPLNHTSPNVPISTKLNFDFENKEVSISYTHNDQNGKIKIDNSNYKYEYEPCFDYRFNHIDLQIVFRFVKESIPNFRINSVYGEKAAESEVKVLNDETVQNILCKKYEIKGVGILANISNVKGYLWVAKNDPRHYTVKYINYAKLDNFWPNFKLELVDIKTIDPGQWKEFETQLLAKANQ